MWTIGLVNGEIGTEMLLSTSDSPASLEELELTRARCFGPLNLSVLLLFLNGVVSGPDVSKLDVTSAFAHALTASL